MRNNVTDLARSLMAEGSKPMERTRKSVHSFTVNCFRAFSSVCSTSGLES
jgi:hypothetical protein